MHHKNGNRLDNRIENLELWIKYQPPGQRVEDIIEWAENIIKTYKAEYEQKIKSINDEKKTKD